MAAYPITKMEDNRDLLSGVAGGQTGKIEGGPSIEAKELLKRAKEFQPKEPLVPQSLQPADFRLDGGSFTGDKTRGGGGRRGNGEQDGLLRPQKVCGEDARSSSADIQGTGKFNEFRARSIRSPEKNGNLEADSRGTTCPLRIHANALLQLVNAQVHGLRS